jgi:hypothetical protein
MYGTLLIEQDLLLTIHISSSSGISINHHMTRDFTVPLLSDNRSSAACTYDVKLAVLVTITYSARDAGHGESIG